jgi:hypothetical protein
VARNFRYYEKKRGTRRTGSQTVGGAGEVVFFTAFLLLGCGGLTAAILFLVVPEWRVNHAFVEHTCKVVRRSVEEVPGDGGTLYMPQVEIEYEVGGIVYPCRTYDIYSCETYRVRGTYFSTREEAERAIVPFVEGRQCVCWYDPARPEIAVVVRGYHWWVWLVFIVPISFIAIGVGGLVYAAFHWGKSAEHRAAIARSGAGREQIELDGQRPRLPNIPDYDDIINSPGTRLAFRLPVSTSPAWRLSGLLLACLLWNGAVGFFLVKAIQGHLGGEEGRWFLTLFVFPFAVVGIWLIVKFVRELLVATGVGPTLVEISGHPLVPGGQFQLFVSQAGRLKVRSLEVSLVCEEQATYRQGTNTRTETREVVRQQVFRREQFEIRHGLPFETECLLEVPAGAMHSFQASHNGIEWKLVVRGDIARWPDFERSFLIVIHPGNGQATA